MIGFPGFGLGVEARKRVTIGKSLVAFGYLIGQQSQSLTCSPYRCRARFQASATSLPRRAYFGTRRTIRLQHRALPEEACSRRSSHPCHRSPTQRAIIREFRSPAPPESWRTLRLLWRVSTLVCHEEPSH